jgi:hypothetical protein
MEKNDTKYITNALITTILDKTQDITTKNKAMDILGYLIKRLLDQPQPQPQSQVQNKHSLNPMAKEFVPVSFYSNELENEKILYSQKILSEKMASFVLYDSSLN